MSRPKINSEQVYKLTAEKLLTKINQWADESVDIEDILNILKHSYDHNNGYKLAKEFEDIGFDPDSELVNILDDTIFIEMECQKDLIKEWVKENNIIPNKKEGDIVSIKHNFKNVTGEIVNVNTDLAQYLVCCKEEGHVKKGIGTQGFLVNFEEVE